VRKECCFAKLATAAFFAPIKELSMKQSMSFENLARGCLCKNNAKILDQQQL
jgi:hypothetical protein